MKPGKIIRCLSDVMSIDLGDDSLNLPSQEEREVAEYLADVILSICNRKQFEYEDQTTLDVYYENLSNDYDEDEEDELEEGPTQSGNGSDYEVDDELKKEHHELSNFSLDFMRSAVDYAYEEDDAGKRRRTWKSVKHRFRTLPNQKYVSRFKKYLARNGTRKQKLPEIDKFVHQTLLEARAQYLPIHDIDLQRWAVKRSKELGLDGFQASEFWIREFKTRHNICSRKITNIVIKREVLDADKIRQSEEDFLKLFKKHSPNYQESKIFNTDQV